jgi:prepilin-type N-terminal cleavage/methylation domain-containing protein
MVRKHLRDPSRAGSIVANTEGFTLLEVLVAILVLTLMVSTAYGTIRVGNLAWRNGIAETSRTDELRTLSGLLRRQLSQTLPLRWQTGGETRIAFQADQNQFRFIGPAPRYATRAGLYEYMLKIEREASMSRLVLYYGAYHPAEDGFSVSNASERVVLTDRFSKVSFSYYGTRNERESGRWFNRWESKNQYFPDLIHLKLAGGEQVASWPDLYLPLHIN